jgi:glycosyltransferase involved in cell wall biosynthesis
MNRAALINGPARPTSFQQNAAEAAKTKVLIIGNDRDYFINHRRHLADRLVALGAEVTVITGGRPPEPGEDSGWTSDYMPIDRFSINPLGNFILFARSLRHIRRIRPDVLHLFTLKPAAFAGLAALLSRRQHGKPERILITIPGLGRLMSPAGTGAGRLSPIVRSLVGRIIRFLSGRAEVLFSFETEHDRNLWLAQGLIRGDNSTVIRGAGCDPKKFYPGPEKKQGERVRILFASRLLRSKGLEAFIATARRLAPRGDAEFIVAGMSDPRDPDSYPVELLERESCISFLGEVREMPALLRSVDLVCLTTLYGEGIPRILIEAAATGVACLATNIAGCREVVEDGTTGTLVPLSDGSQLADALTMATIAYLDDPAKLLHHGRAGLARFSAQEFGVEPVTRRFVELLLDEGAIGGRNLSGKSV